MDETYVKINGKWKYLYRAVDKDGNTIEYLLTAKRDRKVAKRFFKKSIISNGVPEKINILCFAYGILKDTERFALRDCYFLRIDKSGSNKAAIDNYNSENNTDIEIRQCKYLNNIIEQDHRFIKKIMRPMLGFKSFWNHDRNLRHRYLSA